MVVVMDYGPNWPPRPRPARYRRMSGGRAFWLWVRAGVLLGLLVLLVCPPLLRALQVPRQLDPYGQHTTYATTTLGPPAAHRR